MAEIKIKIDHTNYFEHVLTILQASSGCIVDRSNPETIIIFSFGDWDTLITETIKEETAAKILSCTRIYKEENK